MAILIISIATFFGLRDFTFMDRLFNSVSRRYDKLTVKTSSGRILQSKLRDFFEGSTGAIILPQYKFFTSFCIDLKGLQIQHGLQKSTILKSLRPWLSEDLKFEERVHKLSSNSITQFALISIFTWVFYFNSKHLLSEENSSWLPVCILQISGLASFFYFYFRQKNKHFLGLEILFKKAFLFRSLKKVGLSMKEVLTRSQADIDSKTKSTIENDLKRLCTDWTKHGKSIDLELDELLEEISYSRNEKFQKFESHLAILRFVHLLIFYLFGYFLVIFNLLRQLALSY